jgi:enoyl-CoA hydratase/carnithine racemase
LARCAYAIIIDQSHFCTVTPVQMMLTSTPIKDSEALKLGLVDAVVPAAGLLQAAKQHALDIAEGRKPRVLSLSRTGMNSTMQVPGTRSEPKQLPAIAGS